ncbi:UNVERIFIED_CONTAM: hypothetical protein HDU68_007639 [Siphonaria sp. JEL0065]|nr:hypothetical protein HDU68_007639 [Siphonaria sp. JEL0065]
MFRRATTLVAQAPKASIRFASNKPYDPFANAPRAAPEMPDPSASEIWTNKQLKPKELTHKDTFDADEVLAHPLRTPAAKPYTGIGEKLIGPLKWPEFDQSGLLASRNPLIKSPPGPDPSLANFEDDLDAPIGAYPRITHQFTELKDPFKYWDQQGRRNYGEVLADQELQMNQWSHGPGVHRGPFLKAILVVLATFGGMYTAIDAWDPSQHLWQAERDYPYNGLHLELGADPENLEDTAVTARQYKDQYTGTYKSI